MAVQLIDQVGHISTLVQEKRRMFENSGADVIAQKLNLAVDGHSVPRVEVDGCITDRLDQL